MYIARYYILMAFALIGSLSVFASDIKGDFDNDGKVTMADVKMLSDILIGKANSSLTTAQLDFNNDGSVNIGDLTKLIDIVVNSKEGGLDVGIQGWDDTNEDYGGTLSAPQRSSGEVWFEYEPTTLLNGERCSIPLFLYNTASINAFLLTLQLPEGFEFEEINFSYCTLGGNASTHVMDTNLTDSGELKVIAYSTNNTTFEFEGRNAILYVNVFANDDKDFVLGVNDAQFSDTEFDTLYVDGRDPEAWTITRTITYYIDGEWYGSECYEYGSTIIPMEEPLREGYIFSGWNGLPETMPAYDIEVFGSYESGILDVLMSDDGVFNVYSLKGHILMQGVQSIPNLPSGLYIINHKKVFVK